MQINSFRMFLLPESSRRKETLECLFLRTTQKNIHSHSVCTKRCFPNNHEKILIDFDLRTIFVSAFLIQAVD